MPAFFLGNSRFQAAKMLIYYPQPAMECNGSALQRCNPVANLTLESIFSIQTGVSLISDLVMQNQLYNSEI